MVEGKEKKIKVAKPRQKNISGEIKVKRSKKSIVTPVEHVIDLSPMQPAPIYDEPLVRQTIEQKINDSVRWPFVLYRRIALTFVILSLIALAAVAYISLVKVDITVSPRATTVEAQTIFKVYDRPESYDVPDDGVLGLVREMTVEYTQTSPATEKTVSGAEVSGKVEIINTYTKDQPLVATTRLQTSDGQILRLRNSVLVPAGGSVSAEVYADGINDPSFTLADSRLTIPGLWAGLQDKIYAQAKANEVSYKEKAELSVTQADIDEAIRRGKAALVEKAQQDIETVYASYNQKLYQLDENSVSYTVDSKAGDVRPEISVSFKANVSVVAFNDDSLKAKAAAALDQAAADAGVVSSDQPAKALYTLRSVDVSQNIAEISAQAAATASVTNAASLIDTAKITLLSRAQLDSYLQGLKGVEEYKVVFHPSFWPWTPLLSDRINVRIK